MSVFEFVRAGALSLRVVRDEETRRDVAVEVIAHASGPQAELEIAPGDVAVVFERGRACGVLGPGRHHVSTSQAPSLAGESGALDLHVVFVTLAGSLATFVLADAEGGLQPRSRFDVRVHDPAKLAESVVGARPRDVNAWLAAKLEPTVAQTRTVPQGVPAPFQGAVGVEIRSVQRLPRRGEVAATTLFLPAAEATPIPDAPVSVVERATLLDVCPNCATVLGAARYCPACAAPVQAKSECASCGGRLAPDAKFCHRCGAVAAR